MAMTVVKVTETTSNNKNKPYDDDVRYCDNNNDEMVMILGK